MPRVATPVAEPTAVEKCHCAIVDELKRRLAVRILEQDLVHELGRQQVHPCLGETEVWGLSKFRPIVFKRDAQI